MRHFLILIFAALFVTAGAADDEHENDTWRGPIPAEGRVWTSDSHFFVRHWFQMGDAFGNPPVNDRFRVNDPYAATHPDFHARKEPKGNGMMLVPMNVPTRQVEAARLYLELWGGHPGSGHRRVSLNGRSTYPISIPDDSQCTHAYRYIPLKITDLVQGNNALQFNVDGDNTFWGHFIVEEAAIDVLQPADHKSVASLRQTEIEVRVDQSEPEALTSTLHISDAVTSLIARVHYFANYEGFDENGDGETADWHGMTKRKGPLGHLGTSNEPPYQVRWDTSMIPAQDGVQIRALVELANDKEAVAAETLLREQGARYWKATSLFMQTEPTQSLSITHPKGTNVTLIPASKMSIPFWSRNNQRRRCEFNVDPTCLVKGINEAVLLSDTEHHGIEILYPGPTLAIRYLTE